MLTKIIASYVVQHEKNFALYVSQTYKCSHYLQLNNILNFAVIMPSFLFQVSVNLGNFQNILNWTLYLIHKYRSFFSLCPIPGISHLVFFQYHSVIAIPVLTGHESVLSIPEIKFTITMPPKSRTNALTFYTIVLQSRLFSKLKVKGYSLFHYPWGYGHNYTSPYALWSE